MSRDYCLATLAPTTKKDGETDYAPSFLKRMFGTAALPQGGYRIGVAGEDYDELANEYFEGQSISGVQPKLLMNVDNGVFVPVRENGRYIVKPAPRQLPHLPENEHAMMSLARAVSFIVADCMLLPFADGQLGLVVKRFDLLPDGSRLFVEDGASLCNVFSKNKGSDALSYERSLFEMHKAAGFKQVVLMEGLKQVLFAYVTGNNDLHLKNFSMYRKPGCASTTMEGWTPLYDLVSAFPYPAYYGEYLSLSLLDSEIEGQFSDVYEARGYYTMTDFQILGVNLGLREKAVISVLNRLAALIKRHYKDVIRRSFMPDEMKALMEQEIGKKLDCLYHTL